MGGIMQTLHTIIEYLGSWAYASGFVTYSIIAVAKDIIKSYLKL